MTDITLYKFEREGGGTTVSPEKPVDIEYTTAHRLVADEGMILTNGTDYVGCIDTDDVGNWNEIPDESTTEATEEDR